MKGLDVQRILIELHRSLTGKRRQGDLADLLGVDQPRVSKWLSGKARPDGESVVKILALAAKRGIVDSPAAISGGTINLGQPKMADSKARLPGDVGEPSGNGKNHQNPNAERVGGVVYGRRRIKIYGHAMGGAHGEFPLNGNEIGEIETVPEMDDAPDGYAVVVAGDSMEPSLRAGYRAYVDPRAAIRRGDFVVAQIENPGGGPPLAYIKEYDGQSGGSLRLKQSNPSEILRFDSDQVASVHKVVAIAFPR